MSDQILTETELADLRRALGQLRTSVGALRGRYGDITAVRRVVFVMRGGVVYKWSGAKTK